MFKSLLVAGPGFLIGFLLYLPVMLMIEYLIFKESAAHYRTSYFPPVIAIIITLLICAIIPFISALVKIWESRTASIVDTIKTNVSTCKEKIVN